jgi:catechol 2,3-dioxygenase-like lactoylglutathione lyase family enzyme
LKIKLSSIMVENQATALAFYRGVLGFKKSKDIPVGEFRWLTVVSPDGHPDVELVLEPNANPAAKAFQEAMFKQGIPLAAFEADDIEAEANRLKKHFNQVHHESEKARACEAWDFFRYVRQPDPDVPAA